MRISLFGHFGSPNSGNESTLVTILARLRLVYPDCELCCICTNPETVTAWYGIDAVPISTRTVRIWDRRLRLGRRLCMALLGAGEELRQFVRASRMLRGTEMLIVPGTGLLTDAYGLSDWGPYSLLKWSLMAKLRGSRLLFVSVGAGPIHSTLGRLLAKAVLSIADYRSYRDTSSMKYLQSIGFRTKDDRVYPDLVFGLPEAALPPAEDRRRRRPVVGLGLRSDSGKYGLASPSGDTYIGYLESLAVFVGWLLEHDYDVKLLLGDGDTEVIPEFKTVLRARLGSFDENRVGYEETTSFEELLAQLSETAVVVATRFHNVVLSLLMNKPVIAISFHHKCESLMREMGVSEYCHDITHMDADALIRQFEKLVQNADDVRQAVEHGVEESRRALDEQYDLLFAGQADHSHAVHASTVAT